MKKGEALTEERKKAMAEGRRKAREEKLAKGLPLRQKKVKLSKTDKPVMIINGKEKDAFDFFQPIRIAFRTRHIYTMSEKIIKEITDPRIWQNVEYIKRTLEKYVTIEVKPRYKVKWSTLGKE